jgi:hypothetical protein
MNMVSIPDYRITYNNTLQEYGMNILATQDNYFGDSEDPILEDPIPENEPIPENQQVNVHDIYSIIIPNYQEYSHLPRKKMNKKHSNKKHSYNQNKGYRKMGFLKQPGGASCNQRR